MRLVISLFIQLCFVSVSLGVKCNRKPPGSTMQNTPANGKFEIALGEKREDGKQNFYTPDQKYTVTLGTTDDGESKAMFSSFVISVDPEFEPDPKNPRKPLQKDGGILMPLDELSRYSSRCPSSLEQSNLMKKSSVQVYWKSPSAHNGCVTLHAMVAENEEVWYMDDGPLSIRVCEDKTDAADMEPNPISECLACEDAKYELKFQGIWSRNTHPQSYPRNEWATKYSNIIGSSHIFGYSIWDYNTIASRGVTDLVGTGKTETLEEEIKQNLTKVRTVIKGKGHGFPDKNEPTYVTFRADRDHHQISLITAIIPSPDWFLGVSRSELCTSEGKWLKEREINLYPIDAGCDSGTNYESPNELTLPAEPIKRIRPGMTNDPESPFANMTIEHMKPFAKLFIKLIRTYPVNCDDKQENVEEQEEVEEEKEEEASLPEPDNPKRITSPIPPNDPYDSSAIEPEIDEEDTSRCPLSTWSDWGECLGPCNNGTQMRRRYHVVDGEVIDFNYRGPKKVSQECIAEHQNDMFDFQDCPGNCLPETSTPMPYDYLRNYPSNKHGVENQSRNKIKDRQSESAGCYFTEWSEWSQCNCATKKKNRTRMSLQHPKFSAGVQCSKKLTQYRRCAKDECKYNIL